MRKKLKEEAGLTVVEMLAATLVLTLLVLMLNTGLQMVMNTYRNMIAQSEAELLVSTAVDALADELRYAWDVDESQYSETDVPFCYNSSSYGEETHLEVDSKGRIVAKSKKGTWQVLSTGAYGRNDSYREYKVIMKIVPNTDNTFTIHLTVETADTGKKISASTPVEDKDNGIPGGVTVRCLNP